MGFGSTHTISEYYKQQKEPVKKKNSLLSLLSTAKEHGYKKRVTDKNSDLMVPPHWQKKAALPKTSFVGVFDSS